MNIFYLTRPFTWTDAKGRFKGAEIARLVCTTDDLDLADKLSQVSGVGVQFKHFDKPVELTIGYEIASTVTPARALLVVTTEASEELARELHDQLRAMHAEMFLKAPTESSLH